MRYSGAWLAANSEVQLLKLSEHSQLGGDGPGQGVITEPEVGELGEVPDLLRDGARQPVAGEIDPVDPAAGAVAADAVQSTGAVPVVRTGGAAVLVGARAVGRPPRSQVRPAPRAAPRKTYRRIIIIFPSIRS